MAVGPQEAWGEQHLHAASESKARRPPPFISAPLEDAIGVVPSNYKASGWIPPGPRGSIMTDDVSEWINSWKPGANTVLYSKQDSCVAAFASSRGFEYVTLSIIAANAIWLGADTDLNKAQNLAETNPGWIVGENIFAGYFTFEILIRFASFRFKSECLRDRWFVFDSFLVVLMVIETWLMPLVLKSGQRNPLDDLGVLRLLRLLRLSRLARLMRSVPELLTIVKGIAAATRSVGTVFLFLIVLTYVFAILFTGTYRPVKNKEYSDNDATLQEYFGSLGSSMFTLFCQGTLLDDLAGLVNALRMDNEIMLTLLILFILISSFTVLNMLIGILCDVVAQTEAEEAETSKQEVVRKAFSDVFARIDKDGSGRISAAEFDELCQDAKVLQLLEKKLNIDARDLSEMRKLLFTDASGSREMTFDDFLKLLLRLRPDEKASPLDVQQFRQVLRDQERRCLSMTRKLFHQVERIRCLRFGGDIKLSPGMAGDKVAESSETVPCGRAELAKLCTAATVEEIMEELQHRMESG